MNTIMVAINVRLNFKMVANYERLYFKMVAINVRLNFKMVCKKVVIYYATKIGFRTPTFLTFCVENVIFKTYKLQLPPKCLLENFLIC